VPAEVIVVEPTGAETELLVQAGAAQIIGRDAWPHRRAARQKVGLASRSTASTCSIPAGGASMRR
jgi:hypothetical protein